MFCSLKTLVVWIIKGDTKLNEFLRFVIVGFLATGLHYGIYILFLPFINASAAYTIGYAISLMMNFFLSNFFTFKTKPNVMKGIGFGISHAINYLLHILLLNLFLWLGLREQLAPIPVFAIVIPVNFILIRSTLKSTKIKKFLSDKY